MPAIGRLETFGSVTRPDFDSATSDHAPDLAERIREHHKIIGFRNLLIHGYAVVDDAIVWSIATEKLPLLLDDARNLLAELDASAEN